MNTFEIIVVIIAFVFFISFTIWQIIKNGYRQTVIDLIVLAERNFKDNKVKFEYVVTGFINKLPFPINLIPVSIVSKFVQKVFDEIKTALDYREEEK